MDANHSYKHVMQDIEIWLPKVKSGGYFAGHDFEYPDLPDVKHAVDEILGIENIKICDDYVWFYRK
ncbi:MULTISPECIES: class I SAM-dependent methyltransferase [Leuconostoc]|uniref:class I SAM-dependent methyltransferase n=1 Tax=Leuconostoc TaxID=1243 RepID=UPI00123870CE|nr:MULTISPECIES: class I SAM-dependent methyltransferase [Leuconostoc]KAA8371353.1 class I SAM-dependent methyltransferase [Leuconostoc carnosum]